MGKTLAEDILSAKSDTEACAGNIVVVPLDLVFVQDSTGPLTLRQLKKLKKSIKDISKKLEGKPTKKTKRKKSNALKPHEIVKSKETLVYKKCKLDRLTKKLKTRELRLTMFGGRSL